MNRKILEIYALAVCFFTVACFVVILGFALWNIIKLATPEFTIYSSQFKCHQSDEAYRDCYADDTEYTREENPLAFPEGEALTKARTESYESILMSERRDALQELVQEFIFLLINFFVFFFHWRLARYARGQTS